MSINKFRNPINFLNRQSKNRYFIPKSLTVQREVPDDLERVHKTFMQKKYNLKTLSELFNEIEVNYVRSHK
jgi:hypothetical protein